MIFIVVPAYNEEDTIGRVVRGLFEHGFKHVVVVDDGSGDATADKALQAGAVVVRHKLNLGQGAALQTGDDYVFKMGAEAVVHFDADSQFDPADISPALTEMQKTGVDVIFGSRFLDDRSHIPSFKRYVILPLARWINFFFSGLLLSDGQNGFRILSQKALANIQITHDGMAHNTEIMRLVKQQKLSYRESPVQVFYHEYGQGFFGGVRIVGDLLWRFFTK